MVVSQYGGVASAAACSYVCGVLAQVYIQSYNTKHSRVEILPVSRRPRALRSGSQTLRRPVAHLRRPYLRDLTIPTTAKTDSSYSQHLPVAALTAPTLAAAAAAAESLHSYRLWWCSAYHGCRHRRRRYQGCRTSPLMPYSTGEGFVENGRKAEGSLGSGWARAGYRLCWNRGLLDLRRLRGG